MILTEYLNAGKRTQTSRRARKPPHDWVEQKEKNREKRRGKKKKKKNQDGTSNPERAMEDKRNHPPGGPLTCREISWDRGGMSKPRRRVQQLV